MFHIIWQSLFIVMGVVVSYFIIKKAHRKALLSIVVMTIVFYLVSTKILAMLLIQPVCVEQEKADASIVVVIGSNNEHDRILKGLSLAQEKDIPIVFSGVREDSIEMIKKFEVTSAVFEMNSSTTYENAKYTKQILESMKIDKIYLVTSQEHMYRAKKVFEKIGIKVSPVVSKVMDNDMDIYTFAPKIKYFMKNSEIIYEYMAIAVYRFTGRI